ncbi:hypothetical protein DIZ76_014709 [Coccidioides immitis]|nr:hypothetical protein DIZ76_014709 [Coccidioides immitis]
MNGDPKRVVLGKTWNESGEDWNLARATLKTVVILGKEKTRVNECLGLQRKRTTVFGNEALRPKLLDGHPRPLGKEEDVPILVAHGVNLSKLYQSGLSVERATRGETERICKQRARESYSDEPSMRLANDWRWRAEVE